MTTPLHFRNLPATLAGLFRRRSFICGSLILMVLAVFWPVTRCGFLNFDDNEYVTSNPHVLQGFTASDLEWSLTTGHAGNWHPLTWWSHMLDATVFGKNPAGPHLINLLFHAANTVLLFVLLRGLTTAHARSAIVAALFALHPLHVESVAWVAERKDVLSTLFWLLALSAYGNYARNPPEVFDNESNFIALKRTLNPLCWNCDFKLALFFFALGLASKPMVVTLPFVMLLLDYWPLGRFNSGNSKRTILRLVCEKIPFFILSAAVCVITFFVQRRGGAVDSLATLPVGARVANAFVAYVRYLGKTFWPVDLALPYPHPGQWPAGVVAFAIIFVAGVSVIAIWLRRKAPFVFVGWFWFVGTLVPVIGLVQVGIQSLADRYTYVPLIGIFIVLVWSANELRRRFWLPDYFVAGAVGIILMACAARTADQLRYWRNSETLFRHALAVTKNNYLAHDNLGFYLFEKGRVNEAMENYRQALAINPADANALNNLGSALFQQKKIGEAIAAYEEALRVRPDFPQARNNLGVALESTGRTDEAAAQYAEALRLDPENVQALNNLGKSQFTQGRREEAVEYFRRALTLDAEFPEALHNLGWALASLKKFDESERCFARLIKLQPADAAARVSYGRVLAADKKWPEAREQFLAALGLKPDDAETRLELQKLDAQMQKAL